MNVNKQQVIQILNLIQSGSKGWYSGKCPYCDSEKFGIKFDSDYNGQKRTNFNCFKGDCQQHGSIFKLLKDINRLDLINDTFHSKIDIEKKLSNKLNTILLNSTETLDLNTIEKPLPIKFKRIYSDDYLNNRGFNDGHYNTYHIGISDRDYLYKDDYVIFLIMEDNICKGHIGRSRKSKEWIDVYNEELKKNGVDKKYLRWVNSPNTDFEKLLFGIDEINNKTETVILVESITSKSNVDRLLNLFHTDFIKCCATFGKKISKYQIAKLQNKDIKNIILLFDPDAIDRSKKHSLELSQYFNTSVGYIKDEMKDPGNLTEDEMYDVLSNLENALEFNINKIQKKKLEINHGRF